jgi:DNA-binding MarR family transcriptional regulator
MRWSVRRERTHRPVVDDERRVLDAIEANKGITVRKLVKLLGMKTETVTRMYKALVGSGRVQVVAGPRRAQCLYPATVSQTL